ncbi:trypsin-like serine peptidase [Kitasatospora sp. NPDC059673]|uniref:trypsin-like serine peptidase n=1 Tax=Kitasatospora sp. NPDC059673 TaxID=3346901 RepID=UPI0036B4036E
MTSQHRTARRVRSAAAAALVTVLAVTTAACQSQSKTANAAPPASNSSGQPGVDVKDIQGALAKVSSWSASDWADWASKNGFKPEDLEAIKAFWDQKKVSGAQGVKVDKPNTKQWPSLANVVFPKTIPAKAQPHPYSADTAVVGKILFESPEGGMVCSGTVVSDPSHPGKSNLVWTAAHCVHGGKGGDYYKKLVFVPSYNKSGAASNGKGKSATREQIAPLGVWAARSLYVMPQWTTQKEGHSGSAISQFDFAVVRVASQDGSSRSLEETVGGSMPIWFGAQPGEITSASSYGYPADEPFDGQELEHCDSAVKPTPFVFDSSRPPMLAIGCDMTGGASGGGWFTKHDGKTVLFSDNSIGDDTWMAGPNLGPDAKRMFEAFLQDKSGQ